MLIYQLRARRADLVLGTAAVVGRASVFRINRVGLVKCVRVARTLVDLGVVPAAKVSKDESKKEINQENTYGTL